MPTGLTTKRLSAPLSLLGDAAPEGTVKALFSTADIVDSDGDVVAPTAFSDGQEVPMVWSHNWDMPIGKGAVRVQPDGAVFDGRFFTETTAGRDAYLTVKAMGGLQEWSFGFRVTNAEPATVNGKGIRVIKGLECYEVSPVLVGANRNTETLAIKSGEPESTSDTSAAEPEAKQAIEPAAAGDALDFPELKYADHAARLLGAVEAFTRRTADLTSLRAKAGRALSAANRERISGVREQILAAVDEIERLLGETEPADAMPDMPADMGKGLAADVAAVQNEQERLQRQAALWLRQRTLSLLAS